MGYTAEKYGGTETSNINYGKIGNTTSRSQTNSKSEEKSQPTPSVKAVSSHQGQAPEMGFPIIRSMEALKSL
jgi:hypothetical protein